MKTKFSTRMLALVLMLALMVSMVVFNASAADAVETTFNLGANGSASHYDNNTSKTDYSETVTGYTLKITGGTNMYPGSRDAKGNGCIKFGSSKKAGSCTITVPDDVTSVVLYVAKYKTDAATITTNGTATKLTKSSNDGAYDEIAVDTKSTKTISFAVTSGKRAMLNTIKFVSAASIDPTISLEGNNVLQIGDTIELTATPNNFTGNVTVQWESSNENVASVADGKVTGKAMGTATITASVGEGDDKVSQKLDVTVYPASKDPITIAEALEIVALTGSNETPCNYTVIGTVESIDVEYDSDYNNITVTIKDDSASIKVYRMKGGSDLQVGQKIAVSGKLTNYNNQTPEFVNSQYELILDNSVESILEAVNALELKMSLAYKYETDIENVQATANVTDELNNAFTGVSGTNYKDWSDKTAQSVAVYAGQSAGNYESIQMRSDNSNSGIVTTTSGGKIKSIKIVWNDNTADARTLNIYGKNEAYSAATDLYGDAKGDLIASFKKSEGITEAVITGNYTYIGIRSSSGALYIDSISIEWETEAGEGTVEKEVYKDSQFALRFAVGSGLASIEGIDENGYGIQVSTAGKDVYYSIDSSSWTVDGELCYVTVNLGDIINDSTKLSTKFTVKAYVEVDGVKYTSETEKTYSVVDMIKEYHDTLGLTEEVGHLYNYLKAMDLI